MPNKRNIQQLLLILPGLLYFLAKSIQSRFTGCRSVPKNSTGRKQVLIVKLDATGDFLLWLNVAKELRHIYPSEEFEITLLGNYQWSDFAKTIPYFDKVLAVDRPFFFVEPLACGEVLESLCGVTFDVLLHPVYSREFLFGDLFVLACNARKKIGMRGDGINLSRLQRWLGSLFYTDLISGTNGFLNELEHNAQLIRWLGLTEFKATVPSLKGFLKTKSFVQLPLDYYVVMPGAGSSLRMWPTTNFVALMESIYKLTGLTAVICGVGAEEGLGRIIENQLSAPVVNLVGKTSLTDLVTVSASACFIVTNETGGIHIAAVLGTPAVCIVGGGHFGRFIPYNECNTKRQQLPVPVFVKMNCFGCNWNCLYSLSPGEAVPCIKMVSVESVLSAVKMILIGNHNITRRDSM